MRQARLGIALRQPEAVADAAKALVPGGPGKVISRRQRRARTEAQASRATRTPSPGFRPASGVIARMRTRAGNLSAANPSMAVTLSVRRWPRLAIGSTSTTVPVHLHRPHPLLKHRRPDALRPQLGSSASRGRHSDHAQHDRQKSSRTGISQAGEHNRRDHGPERRLHRQREIRADAEPEKQRLEHEPMLALGLQCVTQACERREQAAWRLPVLRRHPPPSFQSSAKRERAGSYPSRPPMLHAAQHRRSSAQSKD